ncbi:MAG: P-loop NTPase [Bacteroidales bacterium]|nr:P-loop NTPase [Bacteroidales bacterium]
MKSDEAIINALKKVVHPEKGKNIVDLGIVANAYEDQEGINIELISDSRKDPFMSSIKSTIVKALKEEFGPDITIAAINIHTEDAAVPETDDKENPLPGVKNIIAVSSGKGGVGKTTVAVNLAIALALQGYRVGLLDADVFGPSVPKMLNAVNYKPQITQVDGVEKISPLKKYGLKVLSTGFFVGANDAVIWRGPMASGFLKQLIELGDWGSLDYLLFDLPPGTSDIHLTLVQELAVTGAIVVTTPQEVALADAIKGVAMFRSDKINVPVLGLVENMSWFTPAELPNNKYYIFGKGGGEKLAKELNVPLLGQIPLVQSICESGDSGIPPALDVDNVGQAFADLAAAVVDAVETRNKTQKPSSKVQMMN